MGESFPGTGQILVGETMTATKGSSYDCTLRWLKTKLLLAIESNEDCSRPFCSAKGFRNELAQGDVRNKNSSSDWRFGWQRRGRIIFEC